MFFFRNCPYISQIVIDQVVYPNEIPRNLIIDFNRAKLIFFFFLHHFSANLEEVLDLSLSLQDYHIQEVVLHSKHQSRGLGTTLSSQDIMALQKQQEECSRRHQQQQKGFFGLVFNKNKGSSLSSDSLGHRSASPSRSDSPEQQQSNKLQSPTENSDQSNQRKTVLPARPHRKRRQAPKPPTDINPDQNKVSETTTKTCSQDMGNRNSSNANGNKDKVVISHSRNSSDSSGYHEASVLSDNPDNSAGRMPETLPRSRQKMQNILEYPRQLAHTSQASKSLGNLATMSNGMLSRGISNASLSSNG